MILSRRKTLFLLLGSGGVIAFAAAVLTYTVPSYKAAVKERWHRWSCPAVPEERSERTVASDGTISYTDPPRFLLGTTPASPNIRADFEERLSTFFTASDHGRGILSVHGTSPAITRQISDVADSLVAIGVSLLLNSAAQDPDVRIIIRIDGPDGELIDWEQKRLKVEEHLSNEWERFNFEWLLRERSISPNDRVAIFITSDAAVSLDAMILVFRSARPLNTLLSHG